MSATLLVELGARYAALGLPAAARAAWTRARVAAPEDAEPLRRLAELALAEENAAAAQEAAEALVASAQGPEARLLLARARLAAGEGAAARRALSALLDRPLPAPLAARAHLVRARLARAESDRDGAQAHALAAFDAILEAEAMRSQPIGEAELALVETGCAAVAACDRAAAAAARLDERGDAPGAAVRAALVAARHARGDADVTEADVDASLAAAVAAEPDSWPLALRLAERRLRRGRLGDASRADAAAALARLADRLAAAPEPAARAALGRALMSLAAAREQEADGDRAAEAAYRDALAACPGLGSAASELAALAVASGDYAAAEAAIERALRADPAQDLAWRNAARVVDAQSAVAGRRAAVARLLEAAEPVAGAAADPVARLVTAVAEGARGDVLGGVHERGHRLKNLLGIIGSRARSARKLAEKDEAVAPELRARLARLEEEIAAAFGEWATYLRSMHTAGPVLEVVPVAPLVEEVVGAVPAAAAAGVAIDVSVPAGVPDVRGDRTLLREALLNVVTNAVEACACAGGRVEVVARGVVAGGAPVVEIEVADTGPGIAPADMARVFSPGFTTKPSGSGVGLAIAERVAAAHRGRVLLDSELGRGTRVSLILRCDPGRVAAPAPRSGEK